MLNWQLTQFSSLAAVSGVCVVLLPRCSEECLKIPKRKADVDKNTIMYPLLRHPDRGEHVCTGATVHYTM